MLYAQFGDLDVHRGGQQTGARHASAGRGIHSDGAEESAPEDDVCPADQAFERLCIASIEVGGSDVAIRR